MPGTKDVQRVETTDAELLATLREVGRQYDRYLTLSRLRELPVASELEDASAEPMPTTDRPIGLVIDPQAYPAPPMGLQVRVDA